MFERLPTSNTNYSIFWKKFLSIEIILILYTHYFRDVLAEKARGKRGRNTRSRTPPVRMPANRKGQKAVNNKNNARAKLFSMPVSPLAKENGNKKAVINSGSNSKSFDDDADAESDITKDEDSDENNPGEPVSAHC